MNSTTKLLIARAERAIHELVRKAGGNVPSPWELACAAVEAMPRRDWYAVSCKQYQEKRAAEELRQRKVIVCRPKIFRHPDDDDFLEFGRMEYRYPGYLFVLIDIEAGELSPVETAPGVDFVVKGAVSNSDKPIPLPAGVIDTLRKFEDEDFDRAIMKRPDKRADLYEGMQVMVDDQTHRLHGQAGTLMELQRKDAKVLIGMANFHVDPAFLKPVVIPKKQKKEKVA